MNAERALAWFLRIGAIITLTALGAVVMPYAWMNAVHQALGLGELPDMPIVGYLTRTLSGIYALHGALLGFVSFDVRRYLPVITCFGVLWLVFGLVMLALDPLLGLPLWWILAEGPTIIAFGAAIWWLAARVRRDVATGEDRSP